MTDKSFVIQSMKINNGGEKSRKSRTAVVHPGPSNDEESDFIVVHHYELGE
jgi:hypothetical protein